MMAVIPSIPPLISFLYQPVWIHEPISAKLLLSILKYRNVTSSATKKLNAPISSSDSSGLASCPEEKNNKPITIPKATMYTRIKPNTLRTGMKYLLNNITLHFRVSIYFAPEFLHCIVPRNVYPILGMGSTESRMYLSTLYKSHKEDYIE